MNAEDEEIELEDQELEQLNLLHHHHFAPQQQQQTRLKTDRIYKNKGVDIDEVLIDIEDKSFKTRTFKDLLLYIPFIAFAILWLTFSTAIKDAYWMNVSLKNSFLDEEVPEITVFRSFKTIQNTDMFYSWLNGVFLETVFDTEDYNGNEFKHIGYINSFNKVFGSIRLRQNRVRNLGGCNIEPQFSSVTNGTCFGSYDISHRSEESYGGPDRNKYQFSECKHRFNYKGRLSRTTYDCSGYFVHIPSDMKLDDALGVSYSLQRDKWIDMQTRSVFVEMFVYNANLNYFANVRGVLEWTAGGGIQPTWQYRVFKLETLHYPSDYVHFSFSMLLVPYVLFYIYRWTRDLYTTHISRVWYYHFVNVWNIVDIVNFVLFLVSFILRIMFFVHPDRSSRMFRIDDASSYPNLDHLAHIYSLDIQVNAVNTIITFFKVFRFFSLHSKLNLLIGVIKRAVWGLFATIVMLFICVSAFAFGGIALFSSNLDQFKDITSAYSSLFRTLIGDFDYDNPKNEYTLLYPVYFSLFVILGFVFILNMFISVINDSFNDVASEKVHDELPVNLMQIQHIYEDIKQYYIETMKNRNKQENINPFIANRQQLAHSDNPLNTYSMRSSSNSTSTLHELNDIDILDKLKAYNQQMLTRSDVKKALGPKSLPELIERVMDKYDENNDGIIDYDDIIRIETEMSNVRMMIYGEDNEKRDPVERMLTELRSKVIQLVEKVDKLEKQTIVLS